MKDLRDEKIGKGVGVGLGVRLRPEQIGDRVIDDLLSFRTLVSGLRVRLLGFF